MLATTLTKTPRGLQKEAEDVHVLRAYHRQGCRSFYRRNLSLNPNGRHTDMMRPEKVTVILFVLIGLIMCQILVSTRVWGQESPSQLQVGMWATYSVDASWQSNIPGLNESSPYEDLKNIDWLRSEIVAISGVNVSVEFETRFKNQTTEVDMLNQNLETGEGNLTVPILFLPYAPLIVKADLKAGEAIPGMFQNVTRMTSRLYAGFQRDVICREWTVSNFGTTVGSYTYFDKSTGLLCEAISNASSSMSGYSMSYSTSIKIMDASMFTNQIHDIAVEGVVLSTAVLYLGGRVNVTVMVKNMGSETETFDVFVYCNSTEAGGNSTEIGHEHITDLGSNSSATLNFDWNITGLSKGNYTVNAVSLAQNDLNLGNDVFSSQAMNMVDPPFEIPQIVLLGAIGGAVVILIATILLYRRRNHRHDAGTEMYDVPPEKRATSFNEKTGERSVNIVHVHTFQSRIRKKSTKEFPSDVVLSNCPSLTI